MNGATGFPGRVARRLITWAEQNADPAGREWIGAMRAELDAIDGGFAQLRWAAGALPILWRPYRGDAARFLLGIATVVVVNYSYPKLTTARPLELLFFAQQFYLPLVGMFAARSTHRVLAGTVLGVAASVVGFAVLFVLAFGGPDVTALLQSGNLSTYLQILFFAVIGAAFGTLGATTIVGSSRRALASAS
jgi:hypothetical protein